MIDFLLLLLFNRDYIVARRVKVFLRGETGPEMEAGVLKSRKSSILALLDRKRRLLDAPKIIF